jgi:organic hydroperoxide reductase OsmC/OhrA
VGTNPEELIVAALCGVLQSQLSFIGEEGLTPESIEVNVKLT